LTAETVVPSKLQVEYQKMETVGFIYFTVNTFTDKEWGYGDENPQIFNPSQLDANQWVYNQSGWHELNKARFTADNTARKGNRLDYSGGAVDKHFYLKNCGFTNEKTPIDSYFYRDKLGIAPNIDFNALK